MRPTIPFLTALSLLSIVAAHPFIIFNPTPTPTTTTTITITPAPLPTYHFGKRQGDILSDLQSVADSLLGISTSTSSTKKSATTPKTSPTRSSTITSVRTIPPPVTTSVSSTSESTSSDDDDDDDDDTSTSSDSSTSTTVSTTSTTSTTATTPTPTPTLANVQPTASPLTKNNDNGGVPSGGVAVAVIMSLLVISLAAWLVFKYHPKSQAWWAAREQKKYQERSYRAAIDGQGAGSPHLRQEALGGDGLSRRHTMLKSFFAPSTVRLGNGEEIKRKPVNWGIRSPTTAQSGEGDTEKIAMTADAAPMGQIERYSLMPRSRKHRSIQMMDPSAPIEMDATPITQQQNPISPVSLRPKPSLSGLPPVSPLSTHRVLPSVSQAEIERSLPPLPPVPPTTAAVPALTHAKRGSDGVFRLA